jgi:AcrR family transcriptional regulator
MPRDPEPARRSLIRAGERLLAERGITTVSLREINVAAGQKNSSALHYHFGSREGLLRAILAQHVDAVRDARLTLLKEVTEQGDLDLRSAAGVLVEPLALPLDRGASGRAFCRIIPQVLADPSRSPSELVDVIGDTAREYAYELLAPYCSWLPSPVLLERLYLTQLQVVQAIAARAAMLDDAGRETASSSGFFVANLTDMFVAALTAPVSAATLDALRIVEELDENPTTLSRRRSRVHKEQVR